jgi:short-subunit dehydrogenase involved in D-alanine esterification of teichoic acids
MLIIAAFPTLDTVCILSGKLEHVFFVDPSTSTDESIISEITLNLTAPMTPARFIPHLLTLKQSANFVLVISGMACIPFKFYPV